MELFDKLQERDMALHMQADCHFLNALIGGGISLIGGLFGRSDAKKRDAAAAEAAKVPVVTSHKLDLKGMNAAAIDAGYNPMTILNAGGMSAFTTTSTTGQNAMAAVPTAPSVGSVFANAAMSAFDIFRDDQKTAAAQKVAASSYFPPSPVSGPSFAAAARAPSGVAIGGGAFSAAAPVPAYGFERATATVTDPYGTNSVDTSLADVAAFEERYGDIGAVPFALRNYMGDLMYVATGKTALQRSQEAAGAVPVAPTGVAPTTKAVDWVWERLAGAAVGVTKSPGGFATGAVTPKPPMRSADPYTEPFPAWAW